MVREQGGDTVRRPPIGKETSTQASPPAGPDVSHPPGDLALLGGAGVFGRAIVVTAAAIFVLHSARAFFIPLCLGLLIAYTLNPLVVWLERWRLPRALAATVVMIALLGVGVIGTMALRDQVDRILDQVPDAAGRLSAAFEKMAAEPNTMQKVHAAARELEEATSRSLGESSAKTPPPRRVVVEQPKIKLMDVLWTGSLGVFGFIGDTAMLLLLVFFLLLSGDTFKRKLMRVSGPTLSQRKITVGILDDIHASIQHYMLTLLFANVLLAVLTWIAFRWIGLENAGAWAAAAGVLHFVPYLGPAVTALVTGMAAFMQFGSFPMVLLVSGSSLAIATLVGMVLVTWMCGRLARMNATVVFIALLFWGWLWGPWGVLLAIPIMGMVKVCSEHIDALHPLSELMSE